MSRGLSPQDVARVSPALAHYTGRYVSTEVWDRPGLGHRDRALITLSTLITTGQTIGLPHYVNRALTSGVTPAEISEVVTHLAFYAGWSHAYSALAVVGEVFAEAGIDPSSMPAAEVELLPLLDVVPDEPQRAAFIASSIAPVSPVLSHYTDDLLYHDVWRRPYLNPRDRSLITVASLIASNHAQFLPLYLGRAIAHGVTKVEISELLAHIAFYAGWPRAVAASLVANEILAGVLA